MPLRWRDYNGILRRCQFAPLDHIWISDDILDTALRRFLSPKCSQRHGSSVPGPLEAQRRSNKRRLMGLAPVGRSGVNIDPGFLAGFDRRRDQQKWKWQAPTPSEPSIVPSDYDPPPLPAWLTQNLSSDDADSGSNTADVERPALDSTTPHLTKAQGDISLARDTGAEMASRATQEEKRYLFETSMLPIQEMLKLLVKQTASLDTITGFLEDPTKNLPEAQNLQYLLHAQSQDNMTNPEETATIYHWLRRRTALGLISQAEIIPALETIAHNSNGTIVATWSENLYRAIFEGITMSNVQVCSNSPTYQAFNAFLMSTPPGTLARRTQNLGIEIVRSLHAMDDTGLKLHSRHFLYGWCTCEDVDNHSLQTKGPAVHALLDLLQQMPRDWLRPILREQGVNFLMRLCNSDLGPSIFLKHVDRLGKVSFLSELLPQFEKGLAQESLEMQAKYLRHIDHRAKCLYLVRHWYEKLIGHGRSVGSSFPLRLETCFEQSTYVHPKRSPFINLLASLRALDYYPHAKSQGRLFRLLYALDMPGTVLALISSTRLIPSSRLKTHVQFQYNARVIKQEILRYLFIGKSRIAYKIFQSYHHLALEHVPELAEIIISRPHIHPDAALKYWLCRRKWLGHTKEFSQDRALLRNMRVEILNRMALAYSKASHLSPRMAFGRVHYCYLSLRRERLPLRSDMTRALTSAGVIRYLQAGKWVSTVRFTWILGLVRKTEGEEVADKLDRMVWEWRGEVLDRQRRLKQTAREAEARPRAREPGRTPWNLTGKRGRPNWFDWRTCDGE